MKVSDDVIFALDFPESPVDKSPDVQDPELLTGRGSVHIPDSNLRAAIAEALGQKPQCPDYCGGDGKADETLDADGTGVSKI